MNDLNSEKTNPSETCCAITDRALYILRESSDYTGFDDDHEDSPHWMDRHHDYGGSEDWATKKSGNL